MKLRSLPGLLPYFLPLIIGTLFWFPRAAEGRLPDFWKRAFFYKDIYHFVGHPVPSPNFRENSKFKQTFISHCDRLNRIIIPFYYDATKVSSLLTFKLYSEESGSEAIFSSRIDPTQWPLPHKMGSYHLSGIFHHVWIPVQPKSKDKQFTWELFSNNEKDLEGTGIYLTKEAIAQVKPILYEMGSDKNLYAAFYSYCQYSFNWQNIFNRTWGRVKREKKFMLFYFATLFALCIGFRYIRDS